MIKEPTYILESLSCCIDFVLTTPANMVVESGVHHLPNLTQKINYPPPHERPNFFYA